MTFEGVAAAAGVSKDFLYRSPLRARIERLRKDQRERATPRTISSSPNNHLDESGGIVRTLTLELSELRRQHREETAELRRALEVAHGELLAIRRRHGISD